MHLILRDDDTLINDLASKEVAVGMPSYEQNHAEATCSK